VQNKNALPSPCGDGSALSFPCSPIRLPLHRAADDGSSGRGLLLPMRSIIVHLWAKIHRFPDIPSKYPPKIEQALCIRRCKEPVHWGNWEKNAPLQEYSMAGGVLFRRQLYYTHRF